MTMVFIQRRRQISRERRVYKQLCVAYYSGMNRATLIALLCATSTLFAQENTRALPQGQAPKDVRLQPVKDLDGYFPFTPAPSKEQWEKRAKFVREQLLVSL